MLLSDSPHRRYNPLTGEWVLVSPHRTRRPWQGRVEPAARVNTASYDPNCYLCPGNARASGDKNPDYRETLVFINDYSALIPGDHVESIDEKGLLRAESESGLCKVVCFSPRHDLTLSRMSIHEIAGVIRIWTSEYKAIGKLPGIRHVQIFENRGEIMGCSNPHPHGQIWANKNLPVIPAIETRMLEEYHSKNGSCLLCDYAALEVEKRERVVFENSSFAALVPFWAVWPFEVMVLPKRHLASLAEMNAAEVSALADVMRVLGVKYDNLFQASFPYSMGIHQSPTDADHREWHLHLHYYPPLLRSATVRKFMVGYEMLCEAQRDITPETAAQQLRDTPAKHYLEN